MSRGNLCRRKYDELSNQFSAEVSELVQKYGYTMESVDCCMKRLLKIAESRDPTPNDLKVSAALGPMSKGHLERFFQIFRNLTQSQEQEQAQEKTNSFSEETQRNRRGRVSPPSPPYSGSNRQPQSEDDSSSSVEDLLIEVDEPKNSPEQQPIGEEQYEVERIISRTVNADGSYLYHVKWVGYETSSDAENFVEEKDMMCPDLIREFEDLERLKKKQRAKRLEQQAELARRKKLEAEQRERSVKHFFASKFSQDSANGHDFDSNICEVIDMCSSGSSSSEEGFGAQPSRHFWNNSGKHGSRVEECGSLNRTSGHLSDETGSTRCKKSRSEAYRSEPSANQQRTRKNKTMKERNLKRNVLTFSDSDEEVEDQRKTSRAKGRRLKHRSERNETLKRKNQNEADKEDARLPNSGANLHEKPSTSTSSVNLCSTESETDYPKRRVSSPVPMEEGTDRTIVKNEETVERPVVDEDDDPYGGFMYVRRESDGFRKGYKVVKVSVVTEHPVTGRVVGVVVFSHPDGEEFAQYIPLKEIHLNAPTELRQYFLTANGNDQKSLTLSLILQKPNKVQ
ncbi:hypothetical protein Aduo_012337 [Ancylostoma duodenale]